MKVALVYPPDRCLPTILYASLAQLSAVLRHEGHEVVIRDLNVEVFDWLNHKDRLAGYYDFVARRVEELEAKESLSEEERRMYRFLAPLAATPREVILRSEEAAAVLRDKVDFFDPEKFNQAFDDLQVMIRLMYAANPVFDPESRFFVQQTMEALAQPLGDPVVEAYQSGILDDLLAEGPDLVGFALPFSFQFFEMMKVARLLKERAPHVKIVIGGPTVNDYAYRLFAGDELFRYIDFAVAGEGERALAGLARALETGGSLEEVPNLYWCEDGAVRRSPLPPDVPDLNSFPAPDFRGVPFDRYLTPARIANLQTSRGCYYGKCTFCGDGFRRNFRLRSPDLIYQDIKKIHQDSEVEYFLFWDSLAPPKTLKRVAQQIREHGDDIKWFAETKFEKPYAKPELIQTIKEGGCRFLQFGFESASERMLDLIDKGNDIERVDHILDLMRQNDLWAGVSWFIGFPTETPEEARQTYAFVNDRSDRIAMSVYAGTFMLGRDTLVYENPDRFGIRLMETPEGAVDYEMKDGTPHYDRTELDHAFRARGDLPLLNHGAYLLYADRHPERLRAITGLGRYGRVSEDVVDLPEQRPVVAEGVRFAEYRYNPFAADEAGFEQPIRVAYFSKTGCHFPLDPAEQRAFDLVDGRRTVAELVAALDLPEADALVRRLVDRGLLALPGATFARRADTQLVS